MKRKRLADLIHLSNNGSKIIIIGIFVAIAGASFFLLNNTESVGTEQLATTGEVQEPKEEKAVIPMATSPLSGEQVLVERASLPVNAVIVENSPDARPQSGLNEAPVVFEAVAEGGITRFLALYQSEETSPIGPIRSMRPYYIRWAFGFDAGLAHVGGSPEANALADTIGLKNLNQGTYSQYFYRDSTRYAPHNVYSSVEQLNELNTALGYDESEFTPWKRELGTPSELPQATAISVPFSSSLYNVTYEYDASTNTYDRFLAGSPHVNAADSEQISPDVVIVINTSHAVTDSKGRMAITTVGSGPAHVFQNGDVIKGTWSKKSQSDELVFFDDNDTEVTLNQGQVWIGALPTNKSVAY